MTNFLKSLFAPKSYLGIDIGTTSIKAVEIKKTSKGPELINYGILESHGYLKRLNDAIQTSSLNIAVKETSGMVKSLIDKVGFKTKDVIASLPAFASFTTFLDLPDMPAEETMSALKFQIPRYIPLAPEQMNIEWFKIDERVDEKGIKKQQILIIAVPNEKVLKYQEIFKSAGLKLKFLEVESLSLIRAFAGAEEEAVMIIDIGSRSTNIVIAAKGLLRHSVQTDYAGLSLTQAIANGLGIDTVRAEELKKQKGIIERAEEYELSTLTLPFLDVIISEAKRARSTYETGSEKRIRRVILAGGGANLPGLQKYVETETNLPVQIANPFSQLGYPPEMELVRKELAPVLGVAIGAGMKELT